MKKIPVWGSVFAVLLLLYSGMHYLPPASWMRLMFDWCHPASAKTQTELGKLLSIIDYYRQADLQVIFNDNTYSSEWGWRQARAYLAQNGLAEEEDAAQWIQKHAYRTTDGNIIYFLYPDGSQVTMRDAFLGQLAVINQQNNGESKE